MSKYSIGQILECKNDIEIEGFMGTKKTVKAGSKVYIGADNLAHHLDGTLQPLQKENKPDGYAVNGIADWIYMHISNRLPLDKFLEDYDVSKREFKEHIADALEELGMWDSTGNRS